MMRAAVLTAASVVLTTLVLGNAWSQRQQFYPSVVYITKSNPSMAVIYLQSLVLVILMGKLMRKIFFGQLRAAEFEHLMERSWYAVTETCLAFTVFKDDFSPKFVALFTLLLFLKSFHWLAEDRVDYMERSPVITIIFHLRVLSLALVLASLDMFFIQHAYTSTLTKGASVQLVFGFEYSILLTIVINTLVKYVLHSIDLHSENPWENKAVFMLYTELFIGFVKVLLYILFFVIMVRIYTLPLFAVRPMYLTMRAFKKAFNDVVLSRRAIYNMNHLYPDATAEELANTDNVCIICREEMTPTAGATKKLPCGHIFHKNCLRSWFQRQQTCPTCRLDVLRTPSATASTAPGQPQPQQQQQQAMFQQQMAALRNNLEALQAQRHRQQQPAAQQPQQQQQGAGNNQAAPNIFNFVGAGIPPMPPFHFPQQQQQQNATPAPTSPSATTTPTAGATASPTAAGAQRPQFPLPPFPFIPFTVPPPQPPPNFSGLSDDELRAMEGTERNNVEARIKCLRNIQVLLDAAVMEMQQYSSVVARANMASASVAASTASAAAATTSSSATTASASSSTTASDSTVTTLSESSTISSSSPGVTVASSTSSVSVALSSVSTTVQSSSSLSSGVDQQLNGGLRPASETGARPKTQPVSPQSSASSVITASPPSLSSSIPQTVEEAVPSSENEEKKNVEQEEERSRDFEEIRLRRLAVFEEQKKRLMKK